ncbi:MAG: hypothetical protein ACW987_20145 [Candidatus Thorarchaeota archaeon]|jgi:hypothetical protein
MGKAAREKGKRRERWLVKELKKIGIEAWRTGQYRAKIGESPDVTTNGRLSFEVKDRKSLSVFPAMEKMLVEADQFDIPVMVWYNPRYHRTVAVVDWDDMKRLLSDLEEL